MFFRGADRKASEPVHRNALNREIATIIAAIPHEDLAIQWDVATEFGVIEAAGYESEFGPQFVAWWDDLWAGLADRAREQAAQVPAGVELGFHLCYGDANEKHFVEPKDTANLVRSSNELFAAAPRDITWLHLPVPIERDDVDYYAPLARRALPGATEQYLGLVHREDGAEGAQRRIDAALRIRSPTSPRRSMLASPGGITPTLGSSLSRATGLSPMKTPRTSRLLRRTLRGGDPAREIFVVESIDTRFLHEDMFAKITRHTQV